MVLLTNTVTKAQEAAMSMMRLVRVVRTPEHPQAEGILGGL